MARIGPRRLLATRGLAIQAFPKVGYAAGARHEFNAAGSHLWHLRIVLTLVGIYVTPSQPEAPHHSAVVTPASRSAESVFSRTKPFTPRSLSMRMASA